MQYLLKALKWAYGDSLRYLAFMATLTAFIVFLMTLIAYPIQTLAFIIIGGATVGLFLFFDGLGR